MKTLGMILLIFVWFLVMMVGFVAIGANAGAGYVVIILVLGGFFLIVGIGQRNWRL